MVVCFEVHAMFRACNRSASFNPAPFCTQQAHRQTCVIPETEIPDRIFIRGKSERWGVTKSMNLGPRTTPFIFHS
jgi:hypothetical protein